MSGPPSLSVAPPHKSAAPRIERQAGHHREYLAALLDCETGGDQRPRSRRGLDDKDAERHTRDDAVAARDVARLRFGAER